MKQAIIEGYRLSPQQKHIWSLQLKSLALRSQCALLIEGTLDRSLLREALRQVVRRHEILFTTFEQLSGMDIPLQVIAESASLSYCEIDSIASTPSGQEIEIANFLAEQRQLDFNFEQGPLARFCLLVLNPERHLLIATLPALCADVWTLNNLVREIGEAYESSHEGARADDEPLQYAQFSEWQNELLEEEDGEGGRQYWREQQQAVAAAEDCRLPFELPRAMSVTATDAAVYAPQTLSRALDASLLPELEKAAARYEVSERELLLACWNVLLWRLNDRQQVVVNALCDGRKHQELHQTFGLLAEYLPVLSELEGDYEFAEALALVARSQRAAYARQEYFSREEIPAADSSSAPVSSYRQSRLSFGFDFLQWPEPLRLQSLRAAVLHLSCCAEQFKLRLSCVRDSQRDGGLKLEFHY
ncbi:MAG: condensation domain-containing protein, partial [Pyrinomonadaceae bacterium]